MLFTCSLRKRKKFSKENVAHTIQTHTFFYFLFTQPFRKGEIHSIQFSYFCPVTLFSHANEIYRNWMRVQWAILLWFGKRIKLHFGGSNLIINLELVRHFRYIRSSWFDIFAFINVSLLESHFITL